MVVGVPVDGDGVGDAGPGLAGEAVFSGEGGVDPGGVRAGVGVFVGDGAGGVGPTELLDGFWFLR